MNCFIVFDLFSLCMQTLAVNMLFIKKVFFFFYIVCVHEIKSFDIDLNFDGLIAFLFRTKAQMWRK